MSDTNPDPSLGLPHELFAELASVDWHAGHRDVPHPTPATTRQLVDGRVADVEHPCACDTWRVRALFAMRLVTGQAPMSSTRDGRVVRIDLDVEAAPSDEAQQVVALQQVALHEGVGGLLRVVMASAHPATLDAPLVVLTVHGATTTGGGIGLSVTGGSIAAAEPLGATQATEVLGDVLAELTRALRAASEHHGQQEGS